MAPKPKMHRFLFVFVLLNILKEFNSVLLFFCKLLFMFYVIFFILLTFVIRLADEFVSHLFPVNCSIFILNVSFRWLAELLMDYEMGYGQSPQGCQCYKLKIQTYDWCCIINHFVCLLESLTY